MRGIEKLIARRGHLGSCEPGTAMQAVAGDHAGSHLVLALEMTRLGIGSEELVCGQ